MPSDLDAVLPNGRGQTTLPQRIVVRDTEEVRLSVLDHAATAVGDAGLLKVSRLRRVPSRTPRAAVPVRGRRRRFHHSFAADSTDPFSYLLILGVISMAVAIALWIPARHAAKSDPTLALRSE